MRTDIKLGLYALFILGACVFGVLAISRYKRLDRTPAAPQADATEVAVPKEGARASSGYGRVVLYGGLFFFSVVGLGVMLGRDVSQNVGSRVVRGLYNDEGEGVSNPEYEIAEQTWADGRHLEAVSLMREYLKKNPREQHVALRIAEIYEKDLLNPLAAALEYEEVLKQKLPPERWGWSAIHLCNLYGKLNQQEKSIALLRRIDAEYPETPAAEKARKRLEDLGLTSTEEAANVEEAPAPAPEEPSSGPKLPPGFTLKKNLS